MNADSVATFVRGGEESVAIVPGELQFAACGRAGKVGRVVGLNDCVGSERLNYGGFD